MKEEFTNKAASAASLMGNMAGQPMTGRQSSKTLLLEHVERLRRKANQLEALAYSIDHITGDAEGTLYGLLSGEIYRT